MQTTVTSTALLQGLRRDNDSAAWHQFVFRYEPMLIAFARRSGLPEEDARDVAQEALMAFVEAFRAGKYQPELGRMRSWLQGIAFNKIREARRRLAKQDVQVADSGSGTAFLDRIPDDASLKDIFDQEWEQAVYQQCLEEVKHQVGQGTFDAFRLYAIDDWDPQKVADHLGISRNAVYISKNRVLARLRKLQSQIAEIF